MIAIDLEILNRMDMIVMVMKIIDMMMITYSMHICIYIKFNCYYRFVS